MWPAAGITLGVARAPALHPRGTASRANGANKARWLSCAATRRAHLAVELCADRLSDGKRGDDDCERAGAEKHKRRQADPFQRPHDAGRESAAVLHRRDRAERPAAGPAARICCTALREHRPTTAIRASGAALQRARARGARACRRGPCMLVVWECLQGQPTPRLPRELRMASGPPAEQLRPAHTARTARSRVQCSVSRLRS